MSNEVCQDPPAPEPPPTDEELVWAQDITENIINSDDSNDKTSCKPKIATLVFENHSDESYVENELEEDNLVTNCDHVDLRHLDENFGNNTEGVDELFGSPMTGIEMEKENIVNDPVINMLTNT